MREIVISAIAVTLILCMILLFSCESMKKTERQDTLKKIEIALSDYRCEKRDLEEELRLLNNNYIRTTVGASRLLLFFNSPDKEFIDKIYPKVSEREATGTICLNENNVPGVYSDMSLEMYNDLINEGWEFALTYDGKATVDKWFDHIKEVLDSAEISTPRTVVIKEKIYTDNVAKELYNLGFDDVIIKANKPDIFREDIEGGARLTDGVGWYTNIAANVIELFASKTGDIAFFVGGEEPDEYYVEDQFTAMFNTLSKSVLENHLIFSTPQKMAEYKKQLNEAYGLTIADYTKTKERIEKRIAELDVLIEEVYKEHMSEE